ncbi:Crp/Fnr family transcriptional regulator [Oleispirillum naphthae]|uniref:Crp/Fnr family transcriptional regulator n=1 Tax=Oleispirillum naphthae TaxID=2838853 RepID=UPI0030825240
MKNDARREFLQHSPLFAGLDAAVLDRVLAVAVTRRLARGETLFQKGDPGDRLFGVLSGRVKVHTTSPEGKDVTLNLFKEGQFFGEIALLDELPRTADAVAMAPCELLVIHRRDFMPLVEVEGRLAMHIIRLLCQRVRATSEMLEDAAFLPLEQRLAKHLLRLVGNYGQPVAGGIEIGLRLSQQELAHMMATTRESVNKQLQSWAQAGWIDLQRSRVTVTDVAALEAILENA